MIGLERSQQLRGDRSGAVAIVDCWLWQMMAENLFSKTIIWRRQRFAIANNSHTQTSRPRRHRLTNPSLSEKTKAAMSFFIAALLSGKGGIRTPGTVTRTPHFECGPIDHSGTFPCAFCGANVRIYFLIPTISTNNLHFFCVSWLIEYDLTNLCVIFAYTKYIILRV